LVSWIPDSDRHQVQSFGSIVIIAAVGGLSENGRTETDVAAAIDPRCIICQASGQTTATQGTIGSTGTHTHNTLDLQTNIVGGIFILVYALLIL